MRVAQTALQMESDSVKLKENDSRHLTEMKMAISLAHLSVGQKVIQMVLMMVLYLVHLTEICLAQLKETTKVTSLARL